MPMNQPTRRKSWGWGYEDEQLPFDQVCALAAGMGEHLGFDGLEPKRAASPDSIHLAPPRVAIPSRLARTCVSDDHTRAMHTYGKAYRDVVRGFYGRYVNSPDVVAFPDTEAEVERLLEWCEQDQLAAIPFGGGTSVVGGVEARLPSGYRGAVSIDLTRLSRVLEVDPVSRAARIQAGATGPELEQQLAADGFTLRFFPQSFQFSTLGGWLATRAAGHFATGPTHIDDLVESIRAVTPSGLWESRRLPGSGAGISPDAMLLGSEGALGLITEAWVRILPKPVHRGGASVRFGSFLAGAVALRAILQAGLQPANARLIDPIEAALNGAGDGQTALLVLGFESADGPVSALLDRCLEICRQAGGTREDVRSAGEADATGAWRDSFLRAPYLRDTLVAIGVLAETFETAITWDRLERFHASIVAAGEFAIERVCGKRGRITTRITHAYPDGAAVYFTVLAPAIRGEEVAQWDQIKAAVSDALIAEGGTITHHHAVGRDHRPWYDQQRPDLFAAALGAAKSAVDPHWILNPGILVDGQIR